MDDRSPPPGTTRRRVLRLAAVAAATAVAGCSSDSPRALPSGSPSPSPSPLPVRSPLPPPSPWPLTTSTLPPVRRWQPSANESLPRLKLTAADAVQRLLTRAPGQTPADVLAGMQDLLAPGLDEVGVLAALDSLSEGVETTGEVVYPQYSGLAPNSQQARLGAAMVVVRRTALDRQGRTSAHTRTVDVRLSVVDGAWRVTGVPSVGGQPVARPAEVSPAAARVLDNPLVDLPDTARWDVHAGLVADDLLDLLAIAADLGPVSVTVMATGHPREVFNTVTVSAHTAGRAVDLWRIDRLDVVDDRAPTGPLARLQAAALASERTSQVGGPPGTDVDGPGSRRSFMDRVHDDHLHLAVLPEGAPPYVAPTAPAG